MKKEEAILQIKRASKHFGGFYAVNDVSLEVKRGQICGLVGPNGSGKSTLFNTILGLQKPDSGDIIFNGTRINDAAPHQIYNMGMVNAFQIPHIFPSMSVLDNILIAARDYPGENMIESLFLRRKWQEKEQKLIEEAMEILKFVNLDTLGFALTSELSGGQRKLLEIARGLMAKPTLFLLDEPAAGVNPVLGKKIFQKLQELNQEGMTFLIIEHRLDLLFEFASWVYVLNKGIIVAMGQPHKIVDNPDFYQAYLGEK